MSEATHTPGPWEIARYTNYNGWSIWAEGRGCIAERWYPSACSEAENDEMKKTARLIAAAPELLAALKRLQASVFQSEPHEPNCGCCYHEAAAAIAKAEGRNA